MFLTTASPKQIGERKSAFLELTKGFEHIYSTRWNKNCKKVHALFYEDLKRDTISEMEKLLEFLEFEKNRLPCLKEHQMGSFHRVGKNDQTSWTELLFNDTERDDLVHRMAVLKTWFINEKQKRNDTFFTLPDWYSFV